MGNQPTIKLKPRTFCEKVGSHHEKFVTFEVILWRFYGILKALNLSLAQLGKSCSGMVLNGA